MPLTREESDFLAMVLWKIDNLKALVDAGPDDPALLDASVTLRMLIVDDFLARALKLTSPSEPLTIPANCLEPCIARWGSQIAFADAGGVTTQAVTVGGILKMHGSASQAEFFAALKSITEAQFPWEKFKKSACLFFNGVAIGRQELIKYVAHRLGGAHYGSGASDKPSFAILDAIQENERGIGGNRVVFSALLAVASSLLRSRQVIGFMHWAESNKVKRSRLAHPREEGKVTAGDLGFTYTIQPPMNPA